jgi:hypothetical protein
MAGAGTTPRTEGAFATEEGNGLRSTQVQPLPREVMVPTDNGRQ